MKKVLFALILFLIPLYVNANVKVMNLKDTLEYKDITPLFDDYEETTDQVTIYLFYSLSCPHCTDFLNYLNEITKENGYMFKLRSYEVSNNEDNYNVYKKVGTYLGQQKFGVPYIVIGESTFYGFGEKDEENVLKAIKEEYNAVENYDVFDHLDEKKEENIVEESKKSNVIIFMAIPIAILLVGIIISTLIKAKE